MLIRRLDHINIRTPALDETVSFYEQVLGLESGAPADLDPSRNAWLYDGSGQPIIHVNMPGLDEVEEPVGATGRFNHVAFECGDFDAAVLRLKSNGIVHETRQAGERPRQIFLRDPNGVRLELNFPAKAHEEGGARG